MLLKPSTIKENRMINPLALRRFKAHLTLVLVITLVLLTHFLLSTNLTAANAAPQTTLSGWLNIVRGDPGPQSTSHDHQDLAYLVDKQGVSTLLQVDANSVESLTGQYVDVVGQVTNPNANQQTREPAVMQVTSVQPSQALNVPASVGLNVVSGSQPWVAVPCRYSDVSATPETQAWFNTLLLGAAPSLDHYWKEQSFNTVNLLGSTSLDWYTLPHPKSYYTTAGGDINLGLVVTDCTALAAGSVNFPSYVGIHLMLNASIGCCAWGGSWTLTLNGVTKTYRTTWLPPWGYQNQSVSAHEAGHGFGLHHSSGPYSATYDSRWDVMSDIWDNCPPNDPTFGCVGVGTISYHKDRLGWIPAARKYIAGLNTQATISIERLDQPVASNNYLMAQIPIPGSSLFYTVEVRKKVGYDVHIVNDAVIIHKVNTGLGDRNAQVVDIDNNNNPNDASAMWVVGETFTDATNNISVAVLSTGSSSYTVKITNGTPSVAATIGVFLNGMFYLRNSNSAGPADITAAFGAAGMLPVAGDWNGDGADSIGVYNPATGVFYLSNSNTTPAVNYSLVLGNPGDTPIAGKWDNTMSTTGVGVFRPSNGLIYVKRALTTGFADYTMVLGNPGDSAVAGDWDGNGYTSIGVFRPSNLTFYLSNTITNGVVFGDFQFTYGSATSKPVAGAWTGGAARIGVFTNGGFYLRNTLSAGTADMAFAFGSANAYPIAGHWSTGPLPPPLNVVAPDNTASGSAPATAAPAPTDAPDSKFD